MNASEEDVTSVVLLISEALDGTYGDVTFSSTPPEDSEFPPGFLAWATIDTVAAGAEMAATGLAEGTNIMAFANGDNLYATVPGTVYVGYDSTLTITNVGDEIITSLYVGLNQGIKGAHGDLVFSYTVPTLVPVDPEYLAWAQTNLFDPDTSIVVTDLPAGVRAKVLTSDTTLPAKYGTVPCEITVSESGDRPK